MVAEQHPNAETQMNPDEVAAFIMSLAVDRPREFMAGFERGVEYGLRRGYIDSFDSPETVSHQAVYGHPEQFHAGWAVGQTLGVIKREAGGRKMIRRGA